MRDFEKRLTGGHPNSLGNTIEVVEEILADEMLFDELFNCYFSKDEIVRLRVSNAVRRVCNARPEIVIPYIDRLLDEISQIDQPSTKWTLAILYDMLEKYFSPKQLSKAKSIVKHNLETEPDWICLNNSMQTLTKWSRSDENLKTWLIPYLEKLSSDPRKSVAKRANKFLGELNGP